MLRNKKIVSTSHIFSAAELVEMCDVNFKLSIHQIFIATWHGESVAVKRFREEIDGSVEINDNEIFGTQIDYNRELAVLAKANNGQTNIVKCYGQGSYADSKFNYHCIVMPFFPRGDLFHFIKNHDKPLSWRIRLSMMKGLKNAVRFLHEQHWIDDDIKSLNLLVTDKHKLRLADFEFTTKEDDEKFASNCTLNWRAPELFDNPFAKPTYACDVYSTTVVFWEIAAWKRPFQAVLSYRAVSAAAKQEPREPIPEDCPPKLAHLITWGWMIDPAKRPTIQQVSDELEAIKPPALK
jgi:serine/threonine protein kinase